MHSRGHSLLAGGGSGSWWRNVRGAHAKARRSLHAAGGRSAVIAASCSGLVAAGVFASASLSQPSPDAQPPKQRRGVLDFGSPLRRCTDVLLVTNLVAFVAQWLSRDALTLWGAKVNSLIAAGQLWRLLTSSLLHTSLIHLLINSHALHTIGPHLEMVSGRERFVAVYVAGALVGTTASFFLTPAPSIGASAALFGLGAALAVFYHRHRNLLGDRSDAVLQQLGLTLAINTAYALANRRIDNWGHLGGMVGGALVAWALGPRLVRDPSSGRIVDSPPVPVLAYQATGGGAAGAFITRSSSNNSSKRRTKKRDDAGDQGDVGGVR